MLGIKSHQNKYIQRLTKSGRAKEESNSKANPNSVFLLPSEQAPSLSSKSPLVSCLIFDLLPRRQPNLFRVQFSILHFINASHMPSENTFSPGSTLSHNVTKNDIIGKATNFKHRIFPGNVEVKKTSFFYTEKEEALNQENIVLNTDNPIISWLKEIFLVSRKCI